MSKTIGEVYHKLTDKEKEIVDEMVHKKKILFLDDRSKRIHSALDRFGSQVTIVCTVKECIKMLSNQEWDFVYLDHDLNFEEFVDSDRKDCGMEVVRWLIDNIDALYCLRRWPHIIIIHSSNAVAAKNMQNKLLAHLQLERKPYTEGSIRAERWQYE